jgi:hypothetical protein
VQKIVSIVVIYEDETQESWNGVGSVSVHDTITKGERARDDKPVRYVNAVLNLPVNP